MLQDAEESGQVEISKSVVLLRQKRTQRYNALTFNIQRQYVTISDDKSHKVHFDVQHLLQSNRHFDVGLDSTPASREIRSERKIRFEREQPAVAVVELSNACKASLDRPINDCFFQRALLRLGKSV